MFHRAEGHVCILGACFCVAIGYFSIKCIQLLIFFEKSLHFGAVHFSQFYKFTLLGSPRMMNRLRKSLRAR